MAKTKNNQKTVNEGVRQELRANKELLKIRQATIQRNTEKMAGIKKQMEDGRIEHRALQSRLATINAKLLLHQQRSTLPLPCTHQFPPWCLRLFGIKPGEVNVSPFIPPREDMQKTFEFNVENGADEFTSFAFAMLGERITSDKLNQLSVQLQKLKMAETGEEIDSVAMDILIFLTR
jgi:hypothetical protein